MSTDPCNENCNDVVEAEAEGTSVPVDLTEMLSSMKLDDQPRIMWTIDFESFKQQVEKFNRFGLRFSESKLIEAKRKYHRKFSPVIITTPGCMIHVPSNSTPADAIFMGLAGNTCLDATANILNYECMYLWVYENLPVFSIKKLMGKYLMECFVSQDFETFKNTALKNAPGLDVSSLAPKNYHHVRGDNTSRLEAKTQRRARLLKLLEGGNWTPGFDPREKIDIFDTFYNTEGITRKCVEEFPLIVPELIKELNVGAQATLIQKCSEFMNLATSTPKPFEDPKMRSELEKIAEAIEKLHYTVTLDSVKLCSSKLLTLAAHYVAESKTSYYPLDPKCELAGLRASYCTPHPVDKIVDPNAKEDIEASTQHLRKRKLELITAIDPEFVPLETVEGWPHRITPLDISLAYKLWKFTCSPTQHMHALSVCSSLLELEKTNTTIKATSGILEFLYRVHVGPEDNMMSPSTHKPDFYPSKDKIYGAVYRERKGSDLPFGENMSNRTIVSMALEHQIPLDQESYGRLLCSSREIGEILKSLCIKPPPTFNVSRMSNTDDSVTCDLCNNKLPNIVLTTVSGHKASPMPPISWFGGFYHYMLAHGVIPHYTFIKPLLDYIVDTKKDCDPEDLEENPATLPSEQEQ